MVVLFYIVLSSKMVVQEVRHNVSGIITMVFEKTFFTEFAWQIKWVG